MQRHHSPLSRFTPDLDFTLQLANEFSAFIHTYAHTGITLGGIKGFEQAILDKVSLHTMTVIRNLNNTH